MTRSRHADELRDERQRSKPTTKDLSNQSMIPLYYQLKELIRHEILSGGYAPGDMLPVVSELMSEHNVSRHVVMRALSELGAEGLIVSRKGVGSFVNHSKLKKTLNFVEGFTSSLMQLGESTSTKVLSSRFVELPEAVRAALEMSGSRKGYFLTRVGYVGDDPIVMVENSYPRAVGEALARHDLADVSTYEVLRRTTHLAATTAQKRLSVTFATLDQASVLGVKEGFALVCVRSLTKDQHEQPFDYSEIYYRSDRVEFRFDSPAAHPTREFDAGTP
jgi:DNA-binding GntR family transcriptional regulator